LSKKKKAKRALLEAFARLNPEQRAALANAQTAITAVAKKHMTIREDNVGLPLERPVLAMDIFRPAIPPPGVLPRGVQPMAMDDSSLIMMQQQCSWAGGILSSMVAEGMTFPGYPYLSELAQRSEYQTLSATIATEMTRKWIVFKSGGDDKGKEKKIAAIDAEFKRLKVRQHFRRAAYLDGMFGRCHIYPEVGDYRDDDEMATPIGNGRDSVSQGKCGRGGLKRLKIVEPVWTYPYNYNANDPLSPNWYRPADWYVMGKRLNASRLLTIVSNEVPDLLKPAYSFGGVALTQRAKPYVDNWLKIRQATTQMVVKYAVWTLKTNMGDVIAGGPAGDLNNRVQMFIQTCNNPGRDGP
jgi:hypothetical protein